MKYILLIAVAGVLVAGGAYFLVNGKDPRTQDAAINSAPIADGQAPHDPLAQQKPEAKLQAVKPAQKEVVEFEEELMERMETMQERRPNMRFDPDEVAAAMQRESAWTPAKEKPTNLPLEPELLNDGRKFFNLDDLKIETLVPGDTMKVNLEEVGQEYEVVIDRVEKHDYDNISWYGHIETGDGQTYRVNFTRGKGLTVGGLSTPEGHFVIQAHGQTGWIATSATLFKIDPDQPDVIYPEDVIAQEKAQKDQANGDSTNAPVDGAVATNEPHDHAH